MIEYTYIGNGNGLTNETKTNWQEGTLGGDTYFIHGTPLEPSKVRRTGISPEFAREYLVDPDGNPIGGGKMLFAFQAVAGSGAPANAAFSVSPAVRRLFESGHSYVFKARANTHFFCTSGTIGPAKETAFPYIIETGDIEHYIPPGSKKTFSWKASKAIAVLSG